MAFHPRGLFLIRLMSCYSCHLAHVTVVRCGACLPGGPSSFWLQPALPHLQASSSFPSGRWRVKAATGASTARRIVLIAAGPPYRGIGFFRRRAKAVFPASSGFCARTTSMLKTLPRTWATPPWTSPRGPRGVVSPGRRKWRSSWRHRPKRLPWRHGNAFLGSLIGLQRSGVPSPNTGCSLQ